MSYAELVLKYIEVLIWPQITLLVLISFKDEFSKLMVNAKKVELPGGITIETFERKLNEAKKLEKRD